MLATLCEYDANEFKTQDGRHEGLLQNVLRYVAQQGQGKDARHVVGCHLTQVTRVQKRVDDIAGNVGDGPASNVVPTTRCTCPVSEVGGLWLMKPVGRELTVKQAAGARTARRSAALTRREDGEEEGRGDEALADMSNWTLALCCGGGSFWCWC